MDPLADKLLVCSALIGLTELDMVPAWMTIVIIAREFIISGFRLVAAEQGIVIAAGYWGKLKTVCQMIMICVMLVIVNPQGFLMDGTLNGAYHALSLIANVLLWLSVVLTIVSLIDYFMKNKGVVKVE